MIYQAKPYLKSHYVSSGGLIGLLCDQTSAQNQTASSSLPLHIHYRWKIVHWYPVHRYPLRWKSFTSSFLVPLPSLLMTTFYTYMEEKEKIPNLKNTRNWPIEYTLDETGLRTGKIRPQEYSILLLKGPTWTMAGRSAKTVNNAQNSIMV